MKKAIYDPCCRASNYRREALFTRPMGDAARKGRKNLAANGKRSNPLKEVGN
ncbi:hypothetical protein [Bacillus cereus]|uniref:hypothetical protein n=1 Tax=Bacillus cereus TaxID=1396 RepID=UPI000307A722|nr:hypothetical protein [Bacillus cereus]